MSVIQTSRFDVYRVLKDGNLLTAEYGVDAGRQLVERISTGGPNRIWIVDFRSADRVNYSFAHQCLLPVVDDFGSMIPGNVGVVAHCKPYDRRHILMGLALPGEVDPDDSENLKTAITRQRRSLLLVVDSKEGPRPEYLGLGVDRSEHESVLAYLDAHERSTVTDARMACGIEDIRAASIVTDLAMRRLVLVAGKRDLDNTYDSLFGLVRGR